MPLQKKTATFVPLSPSPSYTADVVLPLHALPHFSHWNEPVVFIGASTGGTEALKTLLSELPSDFPPVLVAQHMPETFTKAFADRLNQYCQMHVKEAVHGELVQRGHVYIAPGSAHLLVAHAPHGHALQVVLSQASEVNRHRPSVDVLFRSAANEVGRCAVGIILTGMGRDGAHGLLEMKEAGAYNFAQNEASCVVFGMPKEAIALGAANEVLPLPEIASRLIALLAKTSTCVANFGRKL